MCTCAGLALAVAPTRTIRSDHLPKPFLSCPPSSCIPKSQPFHVFPPSSSVSFTVQQNITSFPFNLSFYLFLLDPSIYLFLVSKPPPPPRRYRDLRDRYSHLSIIFISFHFGIPSCWISIDLIGLEKSESVAKSKKNKQMAATSTSSFNKIEKAHQLYRDGRHEEALGFYTEALAIAKNKPQRIALHSNRAACYLKLHDFNKAAEECTSVLELDHNHTGALMLRAQTLVTLKEYQSALFDVNRLMELNPSSDVYLNLQSRLRTQLALTPIPEAEEEALAAELEEEEEMEAELEDEEVEGVTEEVAIVAKVDKNKKIMSPGNNPELLVDRTSEDSSDMHPQGWEAVPKPKGHSRLDYSRWDKVEDDSSEEEDEAEDSQPQYRFRLKTVGVQPVK